jgi:ABC-type multidrug transport system fused ATPase/permease subunit
LDLPRNHTRGVRIGSITLGDGNRIAVIVGVGVLVAMDWRFSLTTLVLFPICIVPVMVFGKKVRKAGIAEENESATMAVILQESFAGVRVIKSFASEDYQVEQFSKSSALQCQNGMKALRSGDIVQPLIESVSACGVVLALLYVYYFNISFMKFLALCSGIFLLYNPLKSLSRIPMLMQKCLASTTNVFDLMQLEPGVWVEGPDGELAPNCDDAANTRCPEPARLSMPGDFAGRSPSSARSRSRRQDRPPHETEMILRRTDARRPKSETTSMGWRDAVVVRWCKLLGKQRLDLG